MSAAIEAKAVRYVAENRVRLTLVHGDRVRAEVRGSALYTVELDGGGIAVLGDVALDDRLAVALGAALSPLRLPEAQELGRVRLVVERLDGHG